MNRNEIINKSIWTITDLYPDSAKDMVVLEDPDSPGTTIALPVVYMPIYDNTMVVEDDPQFVYQLPPILRDHYEELKQVHRTSSVYNNINIRVNGWRRKGGLFYIRTGRTSYFDTLVTNRVMDCEFGEGWTVRRLFEPGPSIHPLETSNLSNHLGVNGFIESQDHYLCFVFRSQSVSVGKQVWGCGVSGSLKTKYSLINGRFTEKGLLNGIVSEIMDELNVTSSVLSVENEQPVRLLFAYRDLIEGGKPHLFFYAKCTMTKEKMNCSFFEKEQSLAANNHADIAVKMSTDGRELLWVRRDDVENPKLFRLYPDRFSIGKQDYFTSPSIAACIQMMRMYLRAQKL